jgi:formate C-acetyltransferase
MSIWIANDELIVGNQAKVARYAPIFPEFSFEWILAEMDEEPFELRDADPFLIDEETKSDLRKIGPYWKGKTVNDLIIGRLPDETPIYLHLNGF